MTRGGVRMKFIDSNVFIYVADSKNHEKRAIARKLISSAVLSRGEEGLTPLVVRQESLAELIS